MSPRIRTPRRAPAIALALIVLPALILFACVQATPTPVVPTAGPTAAIVPPTDAPAAPTAEPEPKEPYRIGAVLSVTGFAAPAGDNERKGVLLAVDQINAAGGIDGHPVELLLEDDESDPTKAVAAMLKLTGEGNVAAILGPSFSSAAMASLDAIRNGGVPVLAMVGAAQVTQAGIPNIFRVAPTDAITVRVILDYLANQLKVKKLGILHLSDAYSTGGAEAFRTLAPNYGMEVVARESGQPSDTDYTTQLINLMGSDAEALLIWFAGPNGAAAAKNATQLGISVPLIFPSSINRSFLEAAGESAEGIVFAGSKFSVAAQLPEGDPQYEAIQKFTQVYQAAYNAPPDMFGGFGWDAAYITFEALARAGSADPSAVFAALEETGHVGVTGKYYWTPADHDGLSPDSMTLITVEGGAFVLATTAVASGN